MAKGDICKISDCYTITRYGDLCDTHRWRYEKYGSYSLPDKSIIKICRAPNCENPVDKAQASRLCVMHRVRWSRHKSFDLPEKEKLPDGIVKICKVHGELNEDTAYFSPNYGHWRCLQCRKTYEENGKKKHPDKDHNINRTHITIGSSRFKFPKAEYNKMLEEQNCLCKICGKPETTKKGGNSKDSDQPRKLSIDHCHDLGEQGILKVRGLLCHRCNSMIAFNKDPSKMSTEAIEYLKAHA